MKYRFLIYISHSYAVPIGLPLEKEIQKRDYEVRWFIDVEENKKFIDSGSILIESVEELVAYNPHIVLSATNVVPDFISGIKVQIFHGFNAQKRPKKNTFTHFRIRGFFDLYCTQGPSTTKIFKKLAKKHKYFDVVETGWSKVDPLFHIEKSTKSSSMIMIASTFTERLSLAYSDDVFNTIKKLSKTGEFKFKMVLHPLLPDSIKKKWLSINNDNFTFINTTHLIPIMKECDILFADTTSVVQEFALQLKPVVTFRHTTEHDYLIQIDEASQIEEALKLALSHPKELIEKIKKFTHQLHPYTDGRSSERIIDTSISFLHQDKKHLKNKPLNLIRKFKIRKKLNYFTFKSYNKPYYVNKNN